jgi:hypothetical protein
MESHNKTLYNVYGMIDLLKQLYKGKSAMKWNQPVL